MTPLFLTDDDLSKRLGVTPAHWKSIVPTLENEGLPRRDALMNDKRYWPAVEKFFSLRAGVNRTTPEVQEDSYGFSGVEDARKRGRDEKALLDSQQAGFRARI